MYLLCYDMLNIILQPLCWLQIGRQGEYIIQISLSSHHVQHGTLYSLHQKSMAVSFWRHRNQVWKWHNQELSHRRRKEQWEGEMQRKCQIWWYLGVQQKKQNEITMSLLTPKSKFNRPVPQQLTFISTCSLVVLLTQVLLLPFLIQQSICILLPTLYL